MPRFIALANSFVTTGLFTAVLNVQFIPGDLTVVYWTDSLIFNVIVNIFILPFFLSHWALK